MHTKDELALTASQFCQWCEGDDHDLKSLRTLLLKLLLAIDSATATEQPPTELEPQQVSYEQWLAVFQNLADLPFQYYRHTFDPLDMNAEKTDVGDLMDDLADIYRDLLPGVLAWRRGHHDAAIDRWVIDYETRWGQHAVDALRVVDAHLRQCRDVL